MTTEEFDDQQIAIHEVEDHSLVRKRKIAELHDDYLSLV